MTPTVSETVVNKITYAASATAFIGGMTLNEFAAIGGLIVAVLALIINTIMSWYFKSQHLEIARRNANRNDEGSGD